MITRVLVPMAMLAGLALSACGGGSDAHAPAAATAPPRATFTPATAASTTPLPITIDRPADAAALSIPFEIAGTADIAEDTLSVTVADAAGTLCEHDLDAVSGAGTRGAWRTTMSFVPRGGTGPVIISAFSRSPRDGTSINVVTRTVQVSGDPPDVVIAEPLCAADLAAESALRVSGTARVSEAALTVELRTSSGAVVGQRQVTTDAAAPATGRWSTELDLTGIPAGRYYLVAYSIAARDGAPEHMFSIPVRITV